MSCFAAVRVYALCQAPWSPTPEPRTSGLRIPLSATESGQESRQMKRLSPSLHSSGSGKAGSADRGEPAMEGLPRKAARPEGPHHGGQAFSTTPLGNLCTSRALVTGRRAADCFASFIPSSLLSLDALFQGPVKGTSTPSAKAAIRLKGTAKREHHKANLIQLHGS